MVQKRVTSVKLAMEKLEHFLELGGTKKDITLLVISGIALIASVCIGEDFTAGEVAFIMQLGGLLEELTVARARAGIEKLAHIRAYQAAGDKVCTIGDSVNDAPALKAADVGIAMGGVGSDIAVDAADIALVDDEVTELPHLIALSKRIVLAITGTLNPVVGALVHNAGSVLVITNSALLLKWRQTASQSFASAGAKSV